MIFKVVVGCNWFKPWLSSSRAEHFLFASHETEMFTWKIKQYANNMMFICCANYYSLAETSF